VINEAEILKQDLQKIEEHLAIVRGIKEIQIDAWISEVKKGAKAYEFVMI